MTSVRKSSIPTFSIPALDLRDPQLRSLHVTDVHEFTSIGYIRNTLSKLLNVRSEEIKLFHPENPFRTIELDDSQTLRDLKITKFSSENRFVQFSILSGSPSPAYNSRQPSSKSISISPAAVGTSGVYFVENPEDKVPSAVFKPYDEEQGMINNPKGFKDKPLKSFFEPGHGIIREYASFILDYKSFCKVPRTRLVRLEDQSFRYSDVKLGTYPKLGALQDYVRDGEEISNYGRNMFSDFEVQKIALLDIRLLNCDRNDENVLVVKRPVEDVNIFERGSYELIPIDHAYCLPGHLRIEQWDWFWINFPQVKRPICPEIISYFKSIDIDSLIKKLSDKVSVSSDCLFLLTLVHHLLASCIDKGMTLYDIATIVARMDENIPSPLEKLIDEAESNAFNTLEARTSRVNYHGLGENKLSKSYEAPNYLDAFLCERRARSNSLATVDNSVWNSPVRKTIFNATDDDVKLSLLELDSSNMTSMFKSQDDGSVSTLTSVDSQSDPEADLTPVRDGSYESCPPMLKSYSNGVVHMKSMEYEREYFNMNRLSLQPHGRDLLIVGRLDSWGLSLNRPLHGSTDEESSPRLNRHPSGESLDRYGDNYSCSGADELDETSNDSDTDKPLSLTEHLSQPSILRRMVSFAAIPSAPMYDYNSFYEEKLTESLAKANSSEPYEVLKGRRVPKIVLKKQFTHESTGFQSLRLSFAKRLIKHLLKRHG